ncbi:MAG: hypothetical protein K0Q97_949 [Bacillota bacterium]|jgi:hypothetical protein|nr:hypothetical protein [Bacillota bacterium]
MKHNKKRIVKIVDELIIFLFSINSTNINVNILENNDEYEITGIGNYNGGHDKKIEKFVKLLNCPKHEEMEECYWELTGESDVGSELALLGMMIDDASINIDDGKLEIILHRSKSSSEIFM